MKPFKTHTGLVAPLDRSNVDMEQIIAKQYLKRVKREGFKDGLFYNWRFDYANRPRPDFVLNDPQYKDASILLARENFGCGACWENATWALLEWGFRVVIASSIADLFYINSLNNGLVPIILDGNEIDQLFAWAGEAPLHLTVDMEQRTVRRENSDWVKSFPMPDYRRDAVLAGFSERDQIDRTLARQQQIAAFEARLPVYKVPHA